MFIRPKLKKRNHAYAKKVCWESTFFHNAAMMWISDVHGHSFRFLVIKHKRFTLLELLIVISIIAILASILLPALREARNKAYETACVNQQKQIGLAISMYANDYAGWLPQGYSLNYPTRFSNNTQTTGIYLLVKDHYVKADSSGNWKDKLNCPVRPYQKICDSGLSGVSSYFWYLGAPSEASGNSPNRLPPEKKEELYLFGDTAGTSWDYGLSAPGVSVDNHKNGVYWAKVDGSVSKYQRKNLVVYLRTQAGNFLVPETCHY